MIANARMYSVSPEAAEAWRQLFLAIASAADVPLEVIEYPAPAPLGALWSRADKAAVFMCGLPYSLSKPRPSLIAAPVPAAPSYKDQAVYWSDFVVRYDSRFETMADVLGHRIAFTTPDSQSGFAAPLRYLSGLDEHSPLFSELISPQQTPLGAIQSVITGLADVAPIDSLALDLMRRYRPELASQVRTLAHTQPRPIPPLTGSAPNEALAAGFANAHLQPATAQWLAMLEIRRFERPLDSDYNILATEFETTLKYWRSHPVAERIHPAYAEVLGGPAAPTGT